MAYGKRFGAGNFAKGFRLHSGEELTNAFIKLLEGGIGRRDSITAHSGGTKAAAVQLDRTLNRIQVCAVNNDSVLLPKAIAGSIVFVINSGAATLAVYGTGTDTIDGAATATADTIATTKVCAYICITAGAWFSLMSA